MTITLDPETDDEVRTLLFCLMSIIVAPCGPTLPLAVVAVLLVKVTVPKFAKGTRDPPEEKSSTIHSALSSWRARDWPEKECVTFLPVVRFSTTAVPAVVLVAVTL